MQLLTVSCILNQKVCNWVILFDIEKRFGSIFLLFHPLDHPSANICVLGLMLLGMFLLTALYGGLESASERARGVDSKFDGMLEKCLCNSYYDGDV